jgi:hypothetical protein
MKLVTNAPLIKRNARIGVVAHLGGLAILIAGMVVTFLLPSRSDLSLLALMAGFVLANVGIFFTNRWGRRPRPDEALDAALKGLDDQYVMVHYRMGTGHALFGPSGVYALVPKFQGGQIRFENNKWRHAGITWMRRFFAQESLGNPSLEAEAEVIGLTRKLHKLLPEDELPPVKAIIVFTAPEAEVTTEGSPTPAMHAEKLKEYMRRQPRAASLRPDQMAKLLEAVGQ